jgi:histidine phosphotransferase ChpT
MMSERVELEALDLAALLCSRVCHDIISPVGAIINGLEVLDESNGEDMKDFAFDLIRKSAAQASAKLQFARLAFGAAGSTGAEIDLGDAEKVATGYMQGEKAEFSFQAPRVLMAKNKVKLLLNLILLAVGAVPRGGSIAVVVEGDAERPLFTLRSSGLREARARRHRWHRDRCPGSAGLLYRSAGAGLRHVGDGRARRRRRRSPGEAGSVRIDLHALSNNRRARLQAKLTVVAYQFFPCAGPCADLRGPGDET